MANRQALMRPKRSLPIPRSSLLFYHALNEGTGDTINDTSGNGYHTVRGDSGSNKPSWTSKGLQFDGSEVTYQRFKLTAPIASIRTLHFCFKAPLAALGQANMAASRVLASSDDSTGLMWILGNRVYGFNGSTGVVNYYEGLQQAAVGKVNINLTGTANYRTPGMRPDGGVIVLSFRSDNTVWVDGLSNQPAMSGLADAVDLSGSYGRVGNVWVGCSSNAAGDVATYANRPASMTLIGIAGYSAAQSDADMLATANGLGAQARNRGETWPWTNVLETNRVVVLMGDSITEYSQTEFETASHDNTFGFKPKLYNVARAGASAIPDLQREVNAKLYYPLANTALQTGSQNIIYIHYGANPSTGDTGSSGIGTFNAIVAAITAMTADLPSNVKFVISPMYSGSGGRDTIKNDLNTRLYNQYGSTPGNRVSVIPAASFPHMVPDGSYSNTTYFSDGVHPATAGKAEQTAGVGAWFAQV